MQVRKSAQTVADHLFAAERALDEAIRCTAALAGALPTARLEANLSAVIAQEAFSGAGRTMLTLTDARAELIRTHDALAEAQTRIGLRNVAFGPEDKTFGAAERTHEPLRVVGARKRA